MLLRSIARVLFLGLVVATSAFAAPPAPKPPAETQTERADPFDRDTPKGTVIGFMKAATDGEHQRAARYLDTRRLPRPIGERIDELLAVLNRALPAQVLDELSTDPEGERDDGLPPNIERIGEFDIGTTTFEILLERFEAKDRAPIWRFSAATLKRIPDIYLNIQPTWVERNLEPHLWSPLTEIRYLGVPLWRWLAFPLAILLTMSLARLLSRVVVAALRPLMHRVTGERAVDPVARIIAPVRVTALSAVVLVWVNNSGLPLLSRFTLGLIGFALGVVGVAWLLTRLIDITMQLERVRLRRLNLLGRISVADLVGRLGKVLVAIVAVLILLRHIDADLTTALAGLGIGGIAIALAAQKTLENLLGGITIISDQPVRVGDLCKVGEVVGTVESIGLRSTQIRTFDRTVVSVPNAQMCAVNIENYGVRDKVWFKPTLSLRYETRPDQLRHVLAEIRRLLYEHPMVETESARVRLARFGGSSLDLDIYSYVKTGEFPTFLEVQEDLLLRIMDIVDASGTTFAFPSSTTYIARDAGLDENKTRRAIAQVDRWRKERELPFPNFHPTRITEIENRIQYPPPDSAVSRPATS